MPLFKPVSKFFTKTTSTWFLFSEPRMFIRLTVIEECRVPHAIEACAQRIADESNGHFELFGVNWHDEHLPQITKEARNSNEL